MFGWKKHYQTKNFIIDRTKFGILLYLQYEANLQHSFLWQTISKYSVNIARKMYYEGEISGKLFSQFRGSVWEIIILFSREHLPKTWTSITVKLVWLKTVYYAGIKISPKKYLTDSLSGMISTTCVKTEENMFTTRQNHY